MKALQTQPKPRQEYIRHSEICVLVDGDDLSMDQWIDEMEVEPALMVGLALAAAVGILLGTAWGTFFIYTLHWGI